MASRASVSVVSRHGGKMVQDLSVESVPAAVDPLRWPETSERALHARRDASPGAVPGPSRDALPGAVVAL